MSAVELYLDLLKKCITDTLFSPEPNVEQENESRFVYEFMQHYIRGRAVSMMPKARFDNLQACIMDVLNHDIPGDFIETGVWRGGGTIFMRAALKACNVTDRVVWVADSFEGLPEPDAVRFPIEAKAHQGTVMKNMFNHFAAGVEDVQANFAAFGMLDGQVRFLKGWFRDTLAGAPIAQLAILRLDGDYFESTMDALTGLYDRLSPGGYVIIDDYGEYRWTYCRKAVDTFREQRGICEPIVMVDSKCGYWQRKREDDCVTA